MFQGPRPFQDWGDMSAEMQRVRAIAAWGTFIINTYGDGSLPLPVCPTTDCSRQMSMDLQKNPNLEYPIYRPCIDDELNDIVWTPCPRSNQVKYPNKPALLGYVMAALAKLTEVTLNIQALFNVKAFKMGIDDLWRETNEFHTLLCRWRQELPHVFGVHNDPVPQVLFFQYVPSSPRPQLRCTDPFS